MLPKLSLQLKNIENCLVSKVTQKIKKPFYED